MWKLNWEKSFVETKSKGESHIVRWKSVFHIYQQMDS